MSIPIKKFALAIGLILFVLGVGLFVYLGFYTRHWADDWCYNADFKNLGFLETLGGYAHNVTYTPSRYSVTVFAGLLQAFDVIGTQSMAGLTIIFWVVGLIFLFSNIARMSDFKISKWNLAFIALVIVYFSIYLSPHIYQSLYWRTGMLTYVTPLVFLPWIFVFITSQGSRGKSSHVFTACTFVLALLGGGFSEASSTVLVSTLGLYVLIAGIGYRQKKTWAVKTLFPALAALVGALAAMALLVLAPTTQIRRERYGDPAGLKELVVLLYQFTYAFFVLSIRDIQNIMIIIMAFFFGFLFYPSATKSIQPEKILLVAVLIGFAIIFLVAASLAPSAYIERGLPAERTMIIPRFIAVLGFVVPSWMAGFALNRIVDKKWLETIVTVLLLATYIFPLYSLIVTMEKVPIYNQRAQIWDAREQEIKAAIANGDEWVGVVSIDGFSVGGIRDFDPKGKKGFWITKCAQKYYDINLRVDLP